VYGIEPSAIYLGGVLGRLHPGAAPVPVATLECAGETDAAGNSPPGSLPTQGNYLAVSFTLLGEHNFDLYTYYLEHIHI
jgi:hypothetical protein